MGRPQATRMPFGVLIDRNGDRVLLGLSGEFSADAGNRFEEAVAEIAREPVADLIVDLSGITFMDSTAPSCSTSSTSGSAAGRP